MEAKKLRPPELVKSALDAYKKMHTEKAKEMGVLARFLAAPTLTIARKIVFPK